ncbi:acetyl/propionyl/methylcrotonyl-CoA carboxylase subunit alpha [Chelativorans sp. AA-79]|uniref:acetyl/propionyl/methylcrotonyl-CoA carboxylase subunit alpha n=1 Tax=Chelativorans sp. AA-79 TaxID=3028735 RepID=UPI0023F657C8|nr:acetyl/propionyl/methylcrotonyl-CoA carboxylase subunit alpha [Chelativorans sp. AA-79]WEX07699.1 acetyl/propionyl/methylcrotonyl-CoA carboxylase subunit alpha [Chelativorans sp. AA-79]
MFRKILIANRGEIAVRVMRTAGRMGISTVAVYSDADARAMHAALADEAVPIGGAAAADSYLDGARIIEAAKTAGAEAIHPGYGFLSENPDFVEAVEKAGLVFIGPSAKAIRAMGHKDAAKRLMEKAGVPVVPGYHGEAQELVVLATKAREIGYPVLIKARAGGGGKGMRRVDDPDQFADALAAARREAKAAFGDSHVLVEKLVETPRHIEVQVFGDRHGNVVHLFERDCSAQRRHQKVIEEAPAPGMTAAMRAAMTQAAVKAALAIGYRGAGTVEFIVDASKGLKPDRFWFMEMNTRLQVEHPVTEMVTGIDLVEWQIRVAAGEALPLAQEEIGLSGHAFEARIYAEDPARDFLPATGTLHHLRFPEDVPDAAIRVETGVREGDAVSPYYDPMIAKLVVHAEDRATALAALATALDETEVAGATVNTPFLARLARDPDFAAGRLDTGLIARRQATLTALPEPAPRTAALAALAASGARFTPEAPDPFDAISAYGHFHPLTHRRTLHHGEQALSFAITGDGQGRFAVRREGGDAETFQLSAEATPRIAAWPGHLTVFEGAASHTFRLADPLLLAEHDAAGDSLRAPMPGLVKLVRAAAGEAVKKGQPLLVLEAMKMEHTITAPHDGVIAEIASEGAQVNDGAVLVRFEA